jgi:hypothetical protein
VSSFCIVQQSAIKVLQSPGSSVCPVLVLARLIITTPGAGTIRRSFSARRLSTRRGSRRNVSCRGCQRSQMHNWSQVCKPDIPKRQGRRNVYQFLLVAEGFSAHKCTIGLRTSLRGKGGGMFINFCNRASAKLHGRLQLTVMKVLSNPCNKAALHTHAWSGLCARTCHDLHDKLGGLLSSQTRPSILKWSWEATA